MSFGLSAGATLPFSVWWLLVSVSDSDALCTSFVADAAERRDRGNEAYLLHSHLHAAASSSTLLLGYRVFARLGMVLHHWMVENLRSDILFYNQRARRPGVCYVRMYIGTQDTFSN